MNKFSLQKFNLIINFFRSNINLTFLPIDTALPKSQDKLNRTVHWIFLLQIVAWGKFLKILSRTTSFHFYLVTHNNFILFSTLFSFDLYLHGWAWKEKGRKRARFSVSILRWNEDICGRKKLIMAKMIFLNLKS